MVMICAPWMLLVSIVRGERRATEIMVRSQRDSMNLETLLRSILLLLPPVLLSHVNLLTLPPGLLSHGNLLTNSMQPLPVLIRTALQE